MTELETANFFRDRAVQDDPYPYFDAVRTRSPVWQEPHFGVFLVTGHDEALSVYNDAARFSSCNVVSGPFMPFPEPFEGDDVTDVIERHRELLPFSDQLPSFDPPKHADHRALMMRLLTPGRLRENEAFMARYSERLLEQLIARGRCDVVEDYAKPFALLVVAELEGVPEEDHAQFAEGFGKVSEGMQHKPLEFLYEQFSAYIEDRRRAPRDDIMTKMATATFPDGSTPDVRDVALLAANLFTGGQETTVRLLSFSLRLLAERPDLQERLRADRDLVPNFIEEMLRYESPLRAQFRMAKVRTTVAGVDIPAGSTMLLLPGAANRDPRKFTDPGTFDPARENAIYHLAFGHGIHHCAGAHLARAEGRVTIDRLLDLTSSFAISEEAHGPADARRWDYLPTYFLRGLERLELELTPA
ncbi:MAG TPA: cytochrome P450 [Acidimicrobiales bacterium]|nr:cytochrome P450 [Acidimicrobiales bacterium]